MSIKDEINAAIGAHGLWKMRLKTVIDTGKSDIDVNVIKVDNQCAFGKWLYGATVTPDIKASANYKKIIDLHRQFHAAAAQVASLATAGKKSDAEALMAPGGNYTSISMKLTQEMMAWSKVLP